MIEIRQTSDYASWFEALRDRETRFRIIARIRRLSLGNFGDVRPVGEGVSELRVNLGPGFRIYLKRQNDELIVLLAGGDKSSQRKDVERAKRIARDL